MARYYDWDKTFSYQTGTNGEFCFVVGAKNIGKTFGIRVSLIKRFLKTGEQFCELSRFKNESASVSSGYLGRLQQRGFFTGYEYKVKNGIGYLGKKTLDEKGGDAVEDWQPFVYFVALSTFQNAKKRTYANVHSFIFDECVIDSKDKYHRYLPNEFSVLANIIDSVAREDYENPKQLHVYMLANSCDLTCPYFRNFGISKIPDYGYSWHNAKSVLLHYVEPWDVKERKANTLVGRMLAGSEESKLVFDNQFIDDNPEFIEDKPSNATFLFGIRYLGVEFGIWQDLKNAIFYVNNKIPRNAKEVYALTKKDSTVNYMAVRKSSVQLKFLLEAFYLNSLRYDTPSTREMFFTMLSFFGIS